MQGGPCTPDEGCPEERLHPNAAAQISLVTEAVDALHSTSFYNAVIAAADEAEANGWAGCLAAIVAYVRSWFLIASCAAVWPCVGVLVYHLTTAIAMGCACGGHDCY